MFQLATVTKIKYRNVAYSVFAENDVLFKFFLRINISQTLKIVNPLRETFYFPVYKRFVNFRRFFVKVKIKNI